MLHTLPANFLESLNEAPGFDKDRFVNVHENTDQVTSIRLNPLKATPATNSLPIEGSVPWCATGRYLSERPSFTLDPVFHGGAYYVQEASSMFLDHIIKEVYKDKPKPERVLDLCAAPGGKSTLLAAALPDSFIVSNEVIKTRVSILAENVSKWGSDNVIVTNNDPKDFMKLSGYFNLMVVDAPCSGSGLFRKDTNAIEEWSPASVEMCTHRQQRILTDSIGCLQQGGHLIYSTCSYSPQEDEDICDWIIDNFKLQPIKITIDSSWGIVESLSQKHQAEGYRFYPDKLKGEGFFIACFKQVNAVDNYYGYNSKLSTVNKQIGAIAAPFVENAGEYILSEQKELVVASPRKWEEAMATIIKVLNVRKSGVAVGTVKGKDLVPHHELALSHLLAANIASIELDLNNALKYLRRQEFYVEIDTKGWIVCSYQHIRIGWIKVLPNRVNNYYPTNWRILKT